MRSCVKIKEETSECLHLVKEPGLYGYSLLAVFTAIGYGAASYSEDPGIMQFMYISFGVFVGLSCIEDHEECVFSKSNREVRITRMSIWDKIISTFTSKPPYIVVLDIDEIINVTIKDETVTYFGKGYQVVLFTSSGMEIGVTESFIYGKDSKDQEQLAEKIKSFLNVPVPVGDEDTCSSSDGEEEGDGMEDGFEHLSKQDIEEELREGPQEG